MMKIDESVKSPNGTLVCQSWQSEA